MIAKRIIPCLDIAEGRIVKGIHFLNLRDAGDPVEQARLYNEQGADELVLLDISATTQGRNTTLDIVQKVASQVFMPLAVGGGIRTSEDMRRLLLSGADKVSVNSAAVRNPQILSGRGAFVRQPVRGAGDRRPAHQRQPHPSLGSVDRWRAHPHRPGCRCLGDPGSGKGRRRNPADQHGCRRDA